MLKRPLGVLVLTCGAEHDWSALELGAWPDSAARAPLELLGAVTDGDTSPAVARRDDFTRFGWSSAGIAGAQ